MNCKQSQKGVSLIFSIFVLTFVLGIALAGATILIKQIQITKDIGYSVIAFYAADSGIEEMLLIRESPSSGCTEASRCDLDNGAKYYIEITPSGGSCPAENYCIKSVGSYRDISRAIEISY